jgi:hypothetical protein
VATPEEVQFEAHLKLLMSLPFEGMLTEDRDALREGINRIKGEYETALTLAKTDKANEKYYKDLADAIAKSVPNITKGAIAASDAFRKGDYIGGSAAIMDICAAAIPVFASLFSAAGPEGALISALFAVIGQILAFFAPKQPSLKDLIEKMLDHLKSEEQIQNMKAVAHSIEVYTIDLRDKTAGVRGPGGRKSIAQILAMPLDNEKQADDFLVEMEALQFGLIRDQQKLDVPAFSTWEVAGYLERGENQSKEGWPEVLGYWCRAYTDLLTANMMLNCLADPKKLDQRISDTDEGNKACPLPKLKKDHCNQALLNLKALAKDLRDAWKSNNTVALRVLKSVTQAARDRGLYIGIGGDQCLYIAVGRKGATTWVYKRNTTYMTRLFINATHEQSGSFTPRYEVMVCGEAEVHRHAVDPIKGDLFDGVEVICHESYDRTKDVTVNFENCRDVCWLPDDTDAKAARLYTVNGWGEDWGSSGRHWVHNYLVTPDGNAARVNWRPETAIWVRDARALIHPAATAPNDPDGPAMAEQNAKPLGPLVVQKQEIIYAGYYYSNVIWAGTQNVFVHVASPWKEYAGIAVDPWFLWVYGPQGFACATHASVIRAMRGEIQSPRWITYAFKGEDFAQAMPDSTPAQREALAASYKTLSLHPCADGTLSISVWNPWAFWTANYEVDLKEQRINTASWVRHGDGLAQIQKMPIPCWKLYASLKQNLDNAARPL